MLPNTDEPPALGDRSNWWGEDDPDTEPPRGHTECEGTDPESYIAHQLLLRFVDPVCSETGAPLTEPDFYLPKQTEVAPGKYQEYRQQRHRCRIEPESGRINWGESTSTAVPEVEYSVYRLAVHTYLAEGEIRRTSLNAYLEFANRVWHDPQYNSKQSLARFIEYVRDEES